MSNEDTAATATAKAAKVNWDRLDVDIVHDGRAITLPSDPGKMSLGKAIEALVRKQKDEEQAFSVHEVIDAFPLDGAVAFVKAMTKLYGWASPVPTPGFFGPTPPQMISVWVTSSSLVSINPSRPSSAPMARRALRPS